MNIEKLLKEYKEGKVEMKAVLNKLSYLPFEDIGIAKIDHHRTLRRGFPEVVFCLGKTVEQVKGIFKVMNKEHHNILLTRAAPEMFKAVKKINKNAKYNKAARTITVEKEIKKIKEGNILILTAGTSDISVGEEAYETAKIMGCNVERVYDVGVAGIHRLLSQKEKIDKADAIIAVAGMEGALPSVVSGLCSKPIIAVPTSVGYGVHLKGLSSLLAMMNSCSAGVVVVNIDNGFGAGYFAAMICDGLEKNIIFKNKNNSQQKLKD